MKAIILNSGIGKRLGPLTKDKPKCLLEISEDETILSRQIDILSNCGVTDYVITTGPFAGLIEEYLIDKYSDFSFTFVNNPKYADTNYIYSLYLSKKYIIDDDIILLHGDLVFNKEICNRFFLQSEQNTVIVSTKLPLPEKDFKGRIKDGFIREISVSIFGDDCVFLLPLYKFSESNMKIWFAEIENFVQRGNTNVYAEDAFNNISSKLELTPIYMDDEICMEVDTLEDLKIARKMLR